MGQEYIYCTLVCADVGFKTRGEGSTPSTGAAASLSALVPFKHPPLSILLSLTPAAAGDGGGGKGGLHTALVCRKDMPLSGHYLFRSFISDLLSGQNMTPVLAEHGVSVTKYIQENNLRHITKNSYLTSVSEAHLLLSSLVWDQVTAMLQISPAVCARKLHAFVTTTAKEIRYTC